MRFPIQSNLWGLDYAWNSESPFSYASSGVVLEVTGSPSKYPFLHLYLHWALDSLQPEVSRLGTYLIGAAVVVVSTELSVVLEKVDGAHRFGQLLIPLGCAVLAMVGLMAH